MTAAENKFGQYYTATQVDAKVKAMEESGISGMPDFSKGQTASCQKSFSNDYHTHGVSCSFTIPKNGWFDNRAFVRNGGRSFGCTNEQEFVSGGTVLWNGHTFPSGASHVKKGDVISLSGSYYHGYGCLGPFIFGLGTFYPDR